MRTLTISIEINGEETPIGTITGNDTNDAVFQYDSDAMKRLRGRAISQALPIQREAFSPAQTRCFFEGLLPEGFTRKSVAQWMHTEEDDYLAILHGLGQECLGAIRICGAEDKNIQASYRKLSLEEVKTLAAEGATKSAELVVNSHLSLTGASGKVGLYFDSEENSWYLPIGTAPSTHIVKQSHIRLRGIVANELLCLKTAQKCGIDIADCFILNTGHGKDDEVLLVSTRYDRKFAQTPRILCGNPVPYRIHQEDMTQALGIASQNKYEHAGAHYMKDMFDLIRRVSASPIEDQLKLWDRIVFNVLIGNTDAHLKNYSLLYAKDFKTVRLAPAYDIISTVVYPSCTKEMAFSIGGDLNLNAISIESFKRAAKEVGLGEHLAIKRLQLMQQKFQNALRTTAQELVKAGFDQAEQICEDINRA